MLRTMTPLRGQRICSKCIDDADLIQYIRSASGPRGCSFCGKRDAPTAPFRDLCTHIRETLEKNYSKAVDELPFESREGGYQGWTSDTYDLLYDTVGLDLPRDHSERLRWAISEEVGEDIWCDYNWLALDHDVSLRFSWDRFCDLIKTRRRFFFHNVGESDGSDPDARSPLQFLEEICIYIERLGLIKTAPSGTNYFRARERSGRKRYTSPTDLGPPPTDVCLQSNRMNPPGISMFYGADRRALAISETRSQKVSLGTFETLRDIRVLDLAHLPAVPGFFSSASRQKRLTLRFLNGFADTIIQPVARDNRVNVDYIPTQVFTEFLRDYPFEGGKVDGIRYRSATGEKGANVVLFADPTNLQDATVLSPYLKPNIWLKLVSVSHR